MTIEQVKKRVLDQLNEFVDGVVVSLKDLDSLYLETQDKITLVKLEHEVALNKINSMIEDLNILSKQKNSLQSEIDLKTKELKEIKSDIDNLENRRLEIAKLFLDAERLSEELEKNKSLNSDIIKEIKINEQKIVFIKDELRILNAEKEGKLKSLNDAIKQKDTELNLLTQDVEKKRVEKDNFIKNLDERESVIIEKEKGIRVVERRLKTVADKLGVGFRL